MSTRVTITTISGTPPFNFDVCDINYNNCSFLGLIPTLSSEVQFYLPPLFDGASSVILQVTDGNNCNTFNVLECRENCYFEINLSKIPITSTPTPTPSPTPTL
jgi:hypothetical protein